MLLHVFLVTKQIVRYLFYYFVVILCVSLFEKHRELIKSELSQVWIELIEIAKDQECKYSSPLISVSEGMVINEEKEVCNSFCLNSSVIGHIKINSIDIPNYGLDFVFCLFGERKRKNCFAMEKTVDLADVF